MKNKIIGITVAVGLTFCSCLYQEPPTSFSDKQVFSSEEGLQGALDGCYGLMMNHYYRGGGTGLHHVAVNSVVLTNMAAEHARIGMTVSRQTENFFANPTYIYPYKVIAACNMLLDRLPNSPVEKRIKDRIEGETRLVRAISYFDLVRSVGRCPLLLHPMEDGELSKMMIPRSSLKEVYTVILNDLRLAEQHMPRKGEQRSWHPHQLAATALKAKVFMQMGSLKEDHFTACRDKQMNEFYASFSTAGADDARRQLWDSCYSNALIVLNSSAYSLAPRYADLFNNRTKNTVESIIELQSNRNYSPTTSITINTLHAPVAKDGTTAPNYGYSPFTPNTPILVSPNKIAASKSTFCEHWKRYGNGKMLIHNTLDAINSNNEEGADPRINTTYLYYNSHRSGCENFATLTIFPNRSIGLTSNGSHPSIRKYYYDEFAGNSSDCNLIYLRLADVILIAAEAANELGHNPQVSLDYVNQLMQRARNGNTTPDRNGNLQPQDWTLAPELTQDSLRTRILYERQFELLCENGDELFDVRRHGTAMLTKYFERHNHWSERLSMPYNAEGWNKSVASLGVYDTKYELTPDFLLKSLFLSIPNQELQINQGIPYSEQNYGW